MSFLRLPISRTIALIATLGTLAGCATWNRHEVLTFFFDGVPVPGSETNAIARAAGNATNDLTGGSASSMVASASAEIVHEPYADKDCTSCHASRYTEKMKGKALDVCFECHDDFLKTAKVRHSPAEDGSCMECHAPHHSPHKGLLVKPVTDLCFDCHDRMPKDLAVHQPVADNDCLACHAAHASNVEKLLKKKLPALCMECHEDYAAGKFKHDPVEEGACFECHAVHTSPNKGLLKKPEPAVCLECHDAKDMAAVDAHKKDPTALCTKCHDPHSAAKEKLLK